MRTADQSCTRVGSTRGSGRVGPGRVRKFTNRSGSGWFGSSSMNVKIYCKICDACHIIHYNNELSMFHVVFYVYGDQAMWQIRSKSYKCGFGINACLSPAQYCLKCLIAARASLVNVGLCCAACAARCAQEPFVSYCTSCACNKTTNVHGNHSDCLCLAILVKY